MAKVSATYTIRLKNQTKKAFNAIGRGLNKTRKAVFSLKTGFVSLAGIAGMGMLIKRSLDVVDKLGKVSSKLGVTSQELQRFRYAAKLAGVQQSMLDMGLQRFIRRVGEAAKGTGEAQDALKTMGVQLTDTNGRVLSATDLLGQVADALKDTKDPAERLRLAFKLFDSEGVAMVNMLQDGKVAFKDVMKEAESLGIILSTQAVKGIEDTNNSLFRLATFLKGNFLQIVAKLAPFIQTITEGIIKWGQEKIAKHDGIGNIAIFIAKQIMQAGISILKTIASITNGFIEFGKTIENLPFMGGRPMQAIKKDIAALESQIGLLNASAKGGKGLLDFFGIGDQSSLETAHKQLQKLNKELTKSKISFTNIKPVTYQNAVDVIEKLIADLEVVDAKTKDIIGTDLGEKTVWDKMRAGFNKYKDTVETGNLTIASITEKAMKSTEDAIVNMIMGVKTSFKDMARMILADLIRLGVRRSITTPLFDMLMPKARGGHVNGGQSYLVGERGAEIFQPSGGGKIIPNHQLNTSTGEVRSVNAEINFNVQAIDAASFNSYLVNNRGTIESIINASLTSNGSVRRTIRQVV